MKQKYISFKIKVKPNGSIFSNKSSHAKFYWEQLYKEKLEQKLQQLEEDYSMYNLYTNTSETAVDFILENFDEFLRDDTETFVNDFIITTKNDRAVAYIIDNMDSIIKKIPHFLSYFCENQTDKAVEFMIQRFEKFGRNEETYWTYFLINENDKAVDYILKNIDLKEHIDIKQNVINKKYDTLFENNNKKIIKFILDHTEEYSSVELPYMENKLCEYLNPIYKSDWNRLLKVDEIINLFIRDPKKFQIIKESCPYYEDVLEILYESENIFKNGKIIPQILQLTNNEIDYSIYQNPHPSAKKHWNSFQDITEDELEFLYTNKSKTAKKYLLDLFKSPYKSKIAVEDVNIPEIVESVFKDFLNNPNNDNLKVFLSPLNTLIDLVAKNFDKVVSIMTKMNEMDNTFHDFMSINLNGNKNLEMITKTFLKDDIVKKHSKIISEFFKYNPASFISEAIFTEDSLTPSPKKTSVKKTSKKTVTTKVPKVSTKKTKKASPKKPSQKKSIPKKVNTKKSSKRVKKPCKDNQEINPDTDRCRKKCKEGETRDEKTKRCRKVKKPCKDDEEINPDTDRCRKKCKEGETRDEKTKRCRKSKK